jgi:hypothetical protein
MILGIYLMGDKNRFTCGKQEEQGEALIFKIFS